MSTLRSASPYERFEQRALARDAVADAVGVGQRVPAPALLVAAHEHVVGGVEDRGCGWSTPLPVQLVDRGREVVRGSRRSARRRRARSAIGVSWPRASSATLPMSIGGRLSITKKPRSSSTCAASERPAPDMPVMIVTSSGGSAVLMRRPSSRSRPACRARSGASRPCRRAYTAVPTASGSHGERERAPLRSAPAASSPSRPPSAAAACGRGRGRRRRRCTDIVIFLPRSWR